MLNLSCEIIMSGEKKWRLTAVQECFIEENVQMLTDTCAFTLPKNVRWQGIDMPDYVPVKRGDKIFVRLGYNKKNETRFVGYVKNVNRGNPLRIECEDGMFLLKQRKAEPNAFRDAKLKDVISFLLKDTKFSFKLADEDMYVGNWRITRDNVAEELQELKKKMMLSAYFRLVGGQSILYVGLKYPTDNVKKITFEYGKNIISDNLEYSDKKNTKIKIEAVSFDRKNKKTKVEIGDKDGDIVKVRIDGLDKKELEKYAKYAYETHKKNSITGDFKTFGIPLVNKCDSIDITTSTGHNSIYFVRSNQITYGNSGYRQNIELEYKL